MKTIQIPQEKNTTLGGQQKVMYAPNQDGDFQTFNYGSSIEEYATSLAVQEYNDLMIQAQKSIQQKISSPIEYYMYKNRMDIPTLASIVGMFSFRVKRHLKYKSFIGLNDKILTKYANAFQITIDELKGFSIDN